MGKYRKFKTAENGDKLPAPENGDEEGNRIGKGMTHLKGLTADDLRNIADALDNPDLWNEEIHNLVIALVGEGKELPEGGISKIIDRGT